MSKDSPTPKKKQAKLTVTDLEQQIAELTEALQRERADAINVRRRAEEDKQRLSGFYKAMVVRELLPVVDNFERALKHIPKESQGQIKLREWVEGVRKILVQFEKALSDLGVERIKTVGEVFDPRFHEAVSMEEGEGVQEVVSEELQAGYTLGDEVLRHAMVRVTTQ